MRFFRRLARRSLRAAIDAAGLRNNLVSGDRVHRSCGGLVSLFLLRLLLGFGEGSAFPTATRALASWTAPRRGFAQGITHAFARFGNAMTPPLIALLIIAMSWRAAFIITGLVSFIWVVIWFWYFRDNPRDHSGVSAQELKELPTQQHSEQLRIPLPLIVAGYCGYI
jgi:MFS family permease